MANRRGDRPAATSARKEAPRSASSKTTVQRCVHEIRALISVGEYLPGQQLRQTQLAQRLKTSRIPIREALSMLESEGVLTYIPHVGHTVVRLDSNELAEIYALRALIETELLKSIDLKEVDVVRLRQLHHEIETAMNDLSIDDITRLNVEFHFAIFGYTPFKIMLAELTRLWNMSGFYRSVQVFDTEQRSRIIEQHGGIIDAIKARDVDQLIASSDLHRSWRLPANAFPIRRNSS